MQEAFNYISEKEMNNKDTSDLKDMLYQISNKCISDISMILPSVQHLDNFLLAANENIDSASPVSKLFYSYEYLLKKTYEETHIPAKYNDEKECDDENTECEFFLTVGSSISFNSIQYNWESFLKDPKDRPSSGKLLSFNLPNAAFLALNNILYYFFHEIGHYININKNKLKRNTCLHEVFLNYCSVYIETARIKGPKPYEWYNEEKVEENRKQMEKDRKMLNDLLFIEKVTPDKEMSISAFTETWRRGLRSIELCDLYKKFPSYLQTAILCLNKDNSFINIIKDAFREARADIIMVSLCDFNIDDYLFVLRKFFKMENLNPMSDVAFVLRFSSVIGFFFRKEGKSMSHYDWLRKIERDCDKANLWFFKNYSPLICTQIGLVIPITEYLIGISNEIEPMEIFSPDKTARHVLMGDYTIKEEEQFHINNWYQCLHNIYQGEKS